MKDSPAQAPPPLGVRLRRGLATALIVLGAAACLLLGLGFHLQLVEARNLMREGRPVDGVVTGLTAGGRRSSRYDFSYSYVVGGVTHAKEHIVIPRREYVRLSLDQPVPVRLDTLDPSRSVTAPELADFESLGNRLFFPALALALLAWATRRIRRRS